jgi:hypothetical protein
MGTMARSKGKHDQETAWSARSNIMYGLFDLGRLMIDDEKKLQAFHNEIANLCNQAYERVKSDVEKHDANELDAFTGHFGVCQRNLEYDQMKKPTSSLYAGLEELLAFMYSDLEVYRPKVNGFLMRAQDAVIDKQYELHYI